MYQRKLQHLALTICKIQVNSSPIPMKEHNDSVELTFQKICFICFNKNPLELVKNPFDFILKAFYLLKIFRFLY